MNRSEVEERATEILASEGSGVNGHPIVPVDVLGIAPHLGLVVMDAKFKDDGLSGAVGYKDGHFLIWVNREQAVTRRRFTVAHEIGHFVLHMDRGANPHTYTDVDGNLYMFRGAAVGERAKEVEANQFAAALLMPSEEVFARVDRVRGEIDTFRLAQEFWVSQVAMEIRLQTLLGTGIFA